MRAKSRRRLNTAAVTNDAGKLEQQYKLKHQVFKLSFTDCQQDKLKAYKSKELAVPENVTFVPIDFNKESLRDKIGRAGFVVGKKTLFMLEGVTMYLSKEAVEDTLSFISESSGKGSKVVFDHIYSGVLRGENKYYGEKGMYKRTAKVGEEWTFALEENETEPFLNKFGFDVKDYCNAHELEERYFKNSSGTVAKINGIHAIVTGIKRLQVPMLQGERLSSPGVDSARKLT